MKRTIIITIGLVLGLTFVFSSCKKEKKEGIVTFGANYHIISTPTTVTVFIDGEKIGALQNPVATINSCGETGTLTKTILVGEHTYKAEIRSVNGDAYTKNVTGTFMLSENECKKIFIDYNQIFDIDCDQEIIVSESEFMNAPFDPFSIIDLKIVDNCLKIKFSASGCNGNSWIVRLIGSKSIGNSMPPYRWLRFSLDNKEECETLIYKEVSFNIEDLQYEGSNKVKLNVSGNVILYEY